jgi:hypothetical protein
MLPTVSAESEVAPMLRVMTDWEGGVLRIKLHGMLGGEWVPLLEQVWRKVLDDVPRARIILVLSDVDFIDADGERLLRLMAESGVQFEVSGCMNRYVVDNLQPR